jgi:hypothetical protein
MATASETTLIEPRKPLRCREMYSYQVYGIAVRSHMRFPLEESGGRLVPAVELRRGDPSQFEELLEGISLEPDPEYWYQLVTFPDGSFYIRWPDLFEFLVSADGRRITYNPLPQASSVAFETYLLGQVLSYSLLKLGYEVLHATAVIVDGEALGFLGDSGYGKSSLAAAFLQAGYRVLSDDLLVLVETPEGILVPPGLPRIKLFPDTAERFLPFCTGGGAMNPLTEKRVIPIPKAHSRRAPALLRVLYKLPYPSARRPNSKVRISQLAEKTAFTELLASTFNSRMLETPRLRRQFETIAGLLTMVPVRHLSYPRGLDHLPQVRDAILADFRRLGRNIPGVV